MNFLEELCKEFSFYYVVNLQRKIPFGQQRSKAVVFHQVMHERPKSSRRTPNFENNMFLGPLLVLPLLIFKRGYFIYK